MKISSLQLALFFQENIERPDIIFSEFIRRLPEFDMIPTTLPIPPQLPADLPLIIHTSKDTKLQCNISRARIDLIMNRIDNESNESFIDTFRTIGENFLKFTLGNTNIIRFGLVGNYFYETSNSISMICEKYINHSMSDLDDITLRYVKSNITNNLKINDSITITTAYGNFNNEEEKEGVSIQRDINSSPDNKAMITLNELQNLFISKINYLKESTMEELIK